MHSYLAQQKRRISSVIAASAIMVGIAPHRTVSAGQRGPRWTRLSLVGDTATQIGISWNSDDEPAEAHVEFGTTPSRLRYRASGQTTFRNQALGSVSEVLLSGLQPDKRYAYRVGGPRSGWSAVHQFRTAPAKHARCARFRFAYVGDSRAEAWQEGQGASDGWPALLRLIERHDPLFLLHGGDFVQDGRRHDQWRHYLETTAPFSRARAISYTLGNHDDGPGIGRNALYNQLLMHPRSEPALGGSGTEDFYAIEVGNAIFISLSTVSFTDGERPFARQARWLDQVLRRSGQLWKIIFMHHPIYTEHLLYNHPPNQVRQNRSFVEVINRHAVDLVIGSHNHFYERFERSRCADPASATPCPSDDPRATVYITSGGGGAFSVFAPGRTDDIRLAASGRHHFLLFEIANNRLQMEAIDREGRLFDRWSREHPQRCARIE
jgi:hypothetical protein